MIRRRSTGTDSKSFWFGKVYNTEWFRERGDMTYVDAEHFWREFI